MAGGTLLIGYGNPGRGDDGLGPAFARRIAARQLPGITIDIDYQLTVDHALMISEAETVVFADAALDAEAATPSPRRRHSPWRDCCSGQHPGASSWACAARNSGRWPRD